MPQGMVTHKPVLAFKYRTDAKLARQIKTFGCCHFPFILMNIFICFELSRSLMLWSSGMLGVYVPCTCVLNGPSDMIPNNGRTGYTLGISDYTLYATSGAF